MEKKKQGEDEELKAAKKAKKDKKVKAEAEEAEAAETPKKKAKKDKKETTEKKDKQKKRKAEEAAEEDEEPAKEEKKAKKAKKSKGNDAKGPSMSGVGLVSGQLLCPWRRGQDLAWTWEWWRFGCKSCGLDCSCRCCRGQGGGERVLRSDAVGMLASRGSGGLFFDLTTNRPAAGVFADEKKKAKVEEVKNEEEEEEAEENGGAAEEEEAEGEEEEEAPTMKVHKKGDAPENPTGTCEVFMGNLSFSVDDDSIKEAFKECGTIVATKWLEHRDTGEACMPASPMLFVTWRIRPVPRPSPTAFRNQQKR